MTDPTDNENEEAARRKKKQGDTGEGDSDSWGRGKAGAGAGIGHLSPVRLKAVMADWRHMDMKAIVEAVAEFFGDMPMRASANLSVAWQQTKENAKSFALVNWVIEFGEKAANELKLTRERVRGADTRGLKNKQEHKIHPSLKLGPAGPTGQ
jgi:hypothetical protein